MGNKKRLQTCSINETLLLPMYAIAYDKMKNSKPGAQLTIQLLHKQPDCSFSDYSLGRLPRSNDRYVQASLGTLKDQLLMSSRL